MALTDALVKKAVEIMLITANTSIDFSKVIKEYNAAGRTMLLQITDIGDGVGFGVADGRLCDTDAITEPTCIVNLNKSIFSSIVTGKMTHQQAFFMGEVEIIGNDWARDSIILSKIFTRIKEVL